MSFHGYEVENLDYNGIEFNVQQLHVGYAYNVPSIFEELRYSNSRPQAIEFAIHDIDGSHPDVTLKNGKVIPGQDWHKWRHSDDNHASPEHMFILRQEIKSLKDALGK